jgi:hypothetical protein
MPRPLPVPIRQALWQRAGKDQDAATIAAELGLAPRTVRRLIDRLQQRGPAALHPSYERCGTATTQPAEALVQAALDLRRGHPTWGAGLIRVMLRHQFPETPLPTERTLQRWLRRADLAPAPVGRRPAADARRATRPHEVWQMDASERIPLATRVLVSWLRVVDECSGAVLGTAVFPPRHLEPGPAPRGAPPVAACLRPLGATRAVPGG